MDMLSIRKVRLHGMTDARWRTKDKITQYKGLIKLYKRDKKISNSDKHLLNKETKRKVAQLKKLMAATYDKLDNALFYGDRQIIKNALASDRRLQLAYQDLPTDVIIEHISQDNFTLRKKLDELEYQKLQKTNQLVEIKVKLAELCDVFTNYQPGNLPVEKEASYYTALVQDAILKKEAAIVVNESYRKIISVMKKDQIYFDQILLNLSQDERRQAKCMLDTIKLGQLAIEYLDDRRDEFNQLAEVVKEDMKTRKETILSTTAVMNSVHKNVRFYIRRDSDVNEIPLMASQYSKGAIQNELNDITTMLDTLKDAFMINDCFKLYDIVIMQKDQHEKLKDLTSKNVTGRDKLANRWNHATLMHMAMINTGTENAQSYKEEKKELMSNIAQQQEKRDEIVHENQRALKVINGIKISLQQLEQICKIIKDPEDQGVFRSTSRTLSKHLQAEVINIKVDCQEILRILERKLSVLTSQSDPKSLSDERIHSLADTLMEKLINVRTFSVFKEDFMRSGDVSNLLDDVEYHDDSSILTRADIKEQCDEMLKEHRLQEEERFGRAN